MKILIWWSVILIVAILWWAAGLAFAILGAIGLAVLAMLVRIDENQCRSRYEREE